MNSISVIATLKELRDDLDFTLLESEKLAIDEAIEAVKFRQDWIDAAEKFCTPKRGKQL